MDSDYGAFMQKFTLQPLPSSVDEFPLNGLTFAIKDIFDVEGHVTGFGNPDWARTHEPAKSTAPTVLAILRAGATSVGKTVMDEMAYSINGENAHYGTPKNPYAPDRIPGGSSSGSAVAVGASLVDFSLGVLSSSFEIFTHILLIMLTIRRSRSPILLGTDTGGSVRVPAAFCKIYGFRPSHGFISVDGVIPMAQSFDTVGWFARDPVLLKRVGRVLLPPIDVHPVSPNPVIIAEDCFKLLNIPVDRVKHVLVKSAERLYGGRVINYMTLGDYIEKNVPSLAHFMNQGGDRKEYNIPSLVALSGAMRTLQRHEFKINHGEWVSSIKPALGPGIAERVWAAVRATDDDVVDICHSIRAELRDALDSLLGDSGVLAIPAVPGPPPKLQTEVTALETFRVRAFSLLSIAGVSGSCQVSIPLGLHDCLPMSVSLLAKHGSDMFLLNLVETLNGTLQEQIGIAEESN